jgi:osmotically-inducible protein OsmY
MAGRWSDDQERYWRERDREGRDRAQGRERQDDRYDVFGLNDERERWSGAENRTFDRGYGADRAERDRPVFGERDSGAAYNREDQRFSHPSNEDRYGRGGWQDPDYGGASPAMRRGDYDTGYRSNPRFGGQDSYRRDSYPRDEGRYAQGGRSYEPEGRRFGSYEADRRWEREMHRPTYGGAGSTYSGGTGGYDYERGYGDGGRSEGRGGGNSGFEDHARDAGDFLRRAGQRISNWFSDVTGEGGYDRPGADQRQRQEAYRGARGLGPKGYKRSDERISDDVHQRLADDPWLDASNIDVSVSAGEVTLSGTVESREAKHRAERIVEDLSGVGHVQNNLRIQSGSFFTSAGRGYGDSANEAAMADRESSSTKDGGDVGATSSTQKRS